MYMHGHFNNNNNNNNNICPICTYRTYIIIIIKITFLNSQLGIQKSDFLGHRKRKSVFYRYFPGDAEDISEISAGILA